MTGAIDVRRLIRIVTLMTCVVAAVLVYFAFEPDLDAAAGRVDRAELQLDSDRTTAFDVPALTAERDALAHRFARLLEQNPQAVFLRGLAADTRRHGVSVVSTAETKDGSETTPALDVHPANVGGSDDLMSEETSISVVLRGSYRALLATIADLSLGPEIVRVDAPTLTRDKASVDAIVPVTIFEPSTRDERPGAAP